MYEIGVQKRGQKVQYQTTRPDGELRRKVGTTRTEDGVSVQIDLLVLHEGLLPLPKRNERLLVQIHLIAIGILTSDSIPLRSTAVAHVRRRTLL